MKALFGILVAAFYIGLPNAFAHGNGPCKPVADACKSAGKKGKDLWKCVRTIKGGGTVEGVTVADADAQACKGAKQK